MTIWSPIGPLRQVFIPAEIDDEELARIFIVGRHWLDKREWIVARLLAQGMSRKEICRELMMSEDVVGESISRLYGKLAASNEKKACYVLGRTGLWLPEE